jgi:hypothetical protein
MSGLIRVGRRVGNKYPTFPGFTPIISLTKSTKFGSISPYELKTDEGIILENAYQFCKIYEEVPFSRQVYSRFDQRVIWEHPTERHVRPLSTKPGFGELTPDFFAWQMKGFSCPYPVRYPVGYGHRQECLGSYYGGKILSYIESRHEIYLPLMTSALAKAPQFHELVARHKKGENLLIIEIDGPHEESLEYYKKNYGVADDWIINNTIEASISNLNIMINDPLHPFGHGYCIALSILSS